METIQESVKETANKMIFSGKSIDFGVKVFEKQLEQLKKYVVQELRGEYNAAVVGIGNNQLRREQSVCNDVKAEQLRTGMTCVRTNSVNFQVK